MILGRIKKSNTLFDDKGRRIPFGNMRVFNKVSSGYYKIKQPHLTFKDILQRSKKFAGVGSAVTPDSFRSICMGLKKKIDDKPSLNGLFDGVHVPFICQIPEGVDLGKTLEETTLPAVAASFNSEFPNLHFKTTLQECSTLAGKLSVAEDSRYDRFIESQKKGIVAGWYFPQALQEYDIISQCAQMRSLPFPDELVLSGGTDTAAALIGSPNLLVNEDNYPPVLCLSALKHADEKLMLCFKAYRQHLEFWCMSQMLTPEVTQVSEQWSGGLTIFANVNSI